MFPTSASCDRVPVCLPAEPAPRLNWLDLHERVTCVRDVGEQETLTDEQLTSRYTIKRAVALVRRIDETHDRYMMVVDSARRVQSIYLPGTNIENIEDVLTNIDAALEFDPELGVDLHRGFLIETGETLADLEPLLNPEFAVQVTGYSLGGAVAAILAPKLELRGYNVESVVTFGQPKVTTFEGSHRLARFALLRLIAGYDGVPLLFDLPYAHHGDEIILLDGPHVVHLSPGDPNYRLSTSFPSQIVDGDLNFEDHGTYVERVASKVGAKVRSVSFCDRALYLPSE